MKDGKRRQAELWRREAPGREGGGLSDPRPSGRQPPKAPIWEAAALFSTAASAGAS